MVLPSIDKIMFTKDFPKGTKICITGAGGFIASHLAKRLKEEGHFVRAVDWKENEYMSEDMFCNEFMNLDLRFPENCAKAVVGMDWCFNLAADMGGMGFIQSNHSRILYNSTMISFNVLEEARKAGVKRFWYASSACIYPEYKQLDENLDGACGLAEKDAWPAVNPCGSSDAHCPPDMTSSARAAEPVPAKRPKFLENCESPLYPVNFPKVKPAVPDLARIEGRAAARYVSRTASCWTSGVSKVVTGANW